MIVSSDVVGIQLGKVVQLVNTRLWVRRYGTIEFLMYQVHSDIAPSPVKEWLVHKT